MMLPDEHVLDNKHGRHFVMKYTFGGCNPVMSLQLGKARLERDL